MDAAAPGLPSILDTISALAGVRRRPSSNMKFYAVKVGRSPGIYHSWNECVPQVKQFKGAVCKQPQRASPSHLFATRLALSSATTLTPPGAFALCLSTVKSFRTLTDAEKFLQSATPVRTTKPKSAPKPKLVKFYGVQSGHVPGVYTDWESAEAQITAFKAPRFKAFPTYAEAEAFVNASHSYSSSSSSSYPPAVQSPSPAPPTRNPDDDELQQPAAKKRKTAKDTTTTTTTPVPDDLIHYDPGEGPLPVDAQDGFDPRITLNPFTGKIEYKTDKHMNKTTWQASTPQENAPLVVYTDGSSLGNGALGAVAGVGVYFGPNHPKNVSEPLPGTRQTNQRAELTALQRALELSPRHRPVHIYTDSNYAIKCVTDWFVKWRQNGWLSASRKPVENKDLVEKILHLLEERERLGGASTRAHFIWVKGHADNPGNNAADELAVAGARQAKELLLAGGDLIGDD